ncbi:MAG: hypothetical protein ABI693_17115 [Bryobacteraceae bacterium]
MNTAALVRRMAVALVLTGSSSMTMGQNIRPLAMGRESFRAAIEKRTRPYRDAVQLQGYEYVVPQLIIGGEWTSTIRLTNRGRNLVPPTDVYFLDNLGNPLPATFQITGGSIITDVGFSFSMDPGSLLELTFFGGSDTLFGHAFVACSAAGCGTPGIYGEVALRNRNATRPDFESVFPLERPYAIQSMLFDGRNGMTTALYLVNENTFLSQVTIDIVDTRNLILRSVNIQLSGLASQILTLHVIAPETTGIQGTLLIHGQNSDGVLITATGLRINPSNSFTPLRAFVLAP